MKFLLPLVALVASSGAALAQTEPAPAAPSASTPVPTTPIFSDVPPGHWAFAAVQTLASAGIIEGYPSGTLTQTQTVAKLAPAPVATISVVKSAVKPVSKAAAKKPVAAKAKAAG